MPLTDKMIANFSEKSAVPLRQLLQYVSGVLGFLKNEKKQIVTLYFPPSACPP